MCGIAGFIDSRGLFHDPRETLVSMGQLLAHRGPDDSGVWWDSARKIGFSHRRLSIVDLTEAGHQPMASTSGRFMLVFNGEIYNALDLRAQLERREAMVWRGHSDTEVMLAAIEAWGIVEAIGKFRGMFALGLFDTKTDTLHLARDLVGKKPLYYGWAGGTFAFASELRALRPLVGGPMGIDRDALSSFVELGYIPGSQCIHPNIYKVPPGTIASITLREAASLEMPTTQLWWDATKRASAARESQIVGSDCSLVDGMEQVLTRAVSARMVGDVPLGAFLSGGVDSALIAATMARVSKSPIQTFTVGFDDPAFDESDSAAALAEAIGSVHTAIRLTARDALGIVPDLAGIFDEPFADSSQIPMVLLSRVVRKHITVALSGDGGDELFGGYDRYLIAPQLWRRLAIAPASIRRALAATTRACAHSRLQAWLIRGMLPMSLRSPRMGEKLERLAAAIGADSFARSCAALDQLGPSLPSLVLGGCAGGRWTEGAIADGNDLALAMMQRDFHHYLPDDLLVKVDRASMSVGLEVRSPFLDQEMVEWAWRVPTRAKIRGSHGKWISHQLAQRIVPGGFAPRPKSGFAVPIANWLRGDLRDWARDLLSPQRIRNNGFFDAACVQKLWDSFETQRGIQRHTAHHRIWALLMFQSWHERMTNLKG